LPWCAEPDKVKAATQLGAVQQDEATTGGIGGETTAASTVGVAGCQRARAANDGESTKLSDSFQLALKPISGSNTDALPMKLAQRQLVAFPATQEEIEATRLAILYGCC
jgi:hypothetical protein